MKLIYDVHDRPKFGQLIIFAIQQLLAIMAATLVVPLIINGNTADLFAAGKIDFVSKMEPAAALLGAGVGSLVYALFTKFKSPVFLGSSFAFLGPMTAAFAGAASMAIGYAGLIIGAIMAGLVYVVISLIVKFAGVKWINKLMPPVVIGPTVTIIGLSLAANAVGDMQKTLVAGTVPYAAIVVALVTLATVMICSTYGKKKMVKLIPFIIGILAGYVVAAIFTLIGNAASIDALKILNFDALTAPFQTLSLSSFFSLPEFTFQEAFNGLAKVDGAYIGSLALAYAPVAFVVFAEHIADHKNLSSIIGRDLLEEPGLSRTLLGDGVGSMAGAFFGGCPNTTYGESVGCVAITKNASVATIFTAAIGAILIAFFTPFVAFVNSIPSAVMGGVCVALYGFIAVSGLKMIQKVNLELNKNLFVVATILICGIGGLTLNFAVGDANLTITSNALALVLGILANLLLKNGKEEEAAEEEAAE